MILLWGLEQDRTFGSVLKILREQDADHLFVNHAAIGRTELEFTTLPKPTYRLTLDRRTYDLEEFTSAYLRPYDHRLYEDPGVGASPRALGAPDVVHHLLMSWAEHSRALIVNRPSADATNQSKLLQATMIRQCGLDVPESLVSNDLEAIRAFRVRHGSVIYKSMSSVRSIVKELDLAALERVGSFGPMLVQQRLFGLNVRVHVVGSEVVACANHSSSIDYRYGECHVERFELPADVTAKCVELTRRLGLIVSGIDLIRTSEGVYYCFEANPNPAFGAFDPNGHADVARLVAARLLAARTPLPREIASRH